MLIVSAAVAVAALLSVTLAVNDASPAVAGVPVICPAALAPAAVSDSACSSGIRKSDGSEMMLLTFLLSCVYHMNEPGGFAAAMAVT